MYISIIMDNIHFERYKKKKKINKLLQYFTHGYCTLVRQINCFHTIRGLEINRLYIIVCSDVLLLKLFLIYSCSKTPLLVKCLRIKNIFQLSCEYNKIPQPP